MKKHKQLHLWILAFLNFLITALSAQPHLHIERNLEALRLDGNQSWLSFWDGPVYKGYLFNNLGNLTLGTTEFNPGGQLKFVTNLTERMTIDHLGRVGVNTGSPLAPMHINHDNEALRISGAQPYLSFYNGLGGYVGYLWNKDLFNMDLGTAIGNNTGNLTLRTRGNLGIWIDPDGLVGIRKAPTVALDIKGDLGIESNFTTHQWTISSGGINTSPPFNQWLGFRLNQTLKSFVDENGNWVVYNNFLQDNSAHLFTVMDRVEKIQISTGTDSNSRRKQDIYFTNQSIKEYFPELVMITKDEKGNEYTGIAYGKVSVIAIKAIQEQQEIIKNLEKEIRLQQIEAQAMQEKIVVLTKAVEALLLNEGLESSDILKTSKTGK